jgi:hypothetical protein
VLGSVLLSHFYHVLEVFYTLLQDLGNIRILLLARSSCLKFFHIEVYRFLSSEVRAYLPSYETVTVWHLRDLAMGVKNIINCDDVKFIDVP